MDMFEPLRAEISNYLSSSEVELVQKAYLLAKQAHQNQKRASGEPYITHPLAVALMLAQNRLDCPTLAATLMHDVIEDTAITKDEIITEFGNEIADLIDSVSKLTQMESASAAQRQADNLKKVIMAMTKDLRVIIIKLHDRLHNMRTIHELPVQKRQRIAKETLDVYVIIAFRLGMQELRYELENLCFQALYPLRFNMLKQTLLQSRETYAPLFKSIQDDIEKALRENNIPLQYTEIKEKSLYSTYQLLKMKQLSIAEIRKIYNIRIIVDNIDACYRTLGVLHQLYRPIPEQFKDCIGIPKANGYRALHTTLFGPDGSPVFVRILTVETNLIAFKGILAYWLTQANPSLAIEQAEENAHVWIKNLLDLQMRTDSSVEFIENIKSDLFRDEIYIFTPKGEVTKLPVGSTPVDFAYSIHSDIGNTCIAAKIDGNLVPLSTPLSNGQKVEIICSPNTTPNPAWLDFVVTVKAKSNIRHALKRTQEKQSIELGKELMDQALHSYSIALKDLPSDYLNKALDLHHLNHIEDLYHAIGQGHIVAPIFLAQVYALTGQPLPNLSSNTLPLIIRGCEGMVIQYAECCKPIPRDPILGELASGIGILIHRDHCNEVDKRKKRQKYVPLQWAPELNQMFHTDIKVVLKDQRGSMAQLASAISDAQADIENISVEPDDGIYNLLHLTIKVQNQAHLDQVLKKLRSVKSIARAQRK